MMEKLKILFSLFSTMFDGHRKTTHTLKKYK
jgi:hypothetical protein